MSVDPPQVIGPSAHGLRRIVPTRGGEVSGPLLQGKVLPGGADWQFVRPDGLLQIEAKYTLQAGDGTLIMVTNRALFIGVTQRTASAAIIKFHELL